MAKELGEVVRDAVGQVAKEAVQSITDGGGGKKSSGGGMNAAKGVAAGAGAATLVPLALKAKKALSGPDGAGMKKVAEKVVGKAGDTVGGKLKDTVSDKVEEAGGAGGLAKEAAKGMLPGGGDDSSGGGEGVAGVGKNRRMPVQQAIDVAVPIETAYNQFTQFEDWPTFMFRVNNVSQEDDCTVNFTVKMWGFTREYTAKIETQRPDERIKWKVSQGITHTGVVTFHELADRLTRVEVNVDVDPGSLIEKAARGMRHVKRAIRSDLHRFKAFIEMQEIETGAWRGVIEDGELVEEHPEEYDEERDYSDVEDAVQDEDSSDDDEEQSSEDDEGDEEEEDDGERTNSERFKRQVKTSSGGRSRSRSSNGNGSGSRSRPGKPRKPAGRR
jgi:uncharacterized membrane protein